VKEITCPLCNGRGRLVVKRRLKVLGEVTCPVCGGKGRVIVVEPSDVVDVEVFQRGTEYEHVIVHHEGALNPRYRDARMTVEEVFRKWREVCFCSHCYGEHIIYKNKLIKTY